MINKVFIEGRLVKDIEVRTTQSGTKLTRGRMAFDTGRFVDNNWHAKDNFIDLTGFGHVAERVMPKFSKGHPVLVEGRLEIDQKGGGQDGTPFQKYPKIIVSDMKLMGKHQTQSAPQQQNPAPNPYQDAPAPLQPAPNPYAENPYEDNPYGSNDYYDDEPGF